MALSHGVSGSSGTLRRLPPASTPVRTAMPLHAAAADCMVNESLCTEDTTPEVCTTVCTYGEDEYSPAGASDMFVMRIDADGWVELDLGLLDEECGSEVGAIQGVEDLLSVEVRSAAHGVAVAKRRPISREAAPSRMIDDAVVTVEAKRRGGPAGLLVAQVELLGAQTDRDARCALGVVGRLRGS